jgi:hypothetical protein
MPRMIIKLELHAGKTQSLRKLKILHMAPNVFRALSRFPLGLGTLLRSQ